MEFADFLVGIVIGVCILFIVLYLISYFGEIQYEFKIKPKNTENFEVSPKPSNFNSLNKNHSNYFNIRKLIKGPLNRKGNECEKNQQIRLEKQDKKIADDVISKSLEILNNNIAKLADTESKLIEKFEELETLNKKTLDTICENNKIEKTKINPEEVMINTRTGQIKRVPNQTMLQQFMLEPESIEQYYKYINAQPVTEDDNILASNYNINKYFTNPLDYVNDELTTSVKEETEVKATNE